MRNGLGELEEASRFGPHLEIEEDRPPSKDGAPHANEDAIAAYGKAFHVESVVLAWNAAEGPHMLVVRQCAREEIAARVSLQPRCGPRQRPPSRILVVVEGHAGERVAVPICFNGS